MTKRKHATWTPSGLLRLVVFWLLSVSAPSLSHAQPADAVVADAAALGATAIVRLESFLADANQATLALPEVADNFSKQEFSQTPLTREQAARATELWSTFQRKKLRQERVTEVELGEIKVGDLSLRFAFKEFGDAPASGHSLFLSMHGGGGAPARVNDQQWANQQRLYEPQVGIYLAPRAPTDTWNLWHEGHIDPLFDRLIEDMVAVKDVDPNRIYLLGYSAGGDGVYQLAPRMADRWAAAAMMAGHPNDASPLGLRNIGFALFMGGKDAAYNRNQVAAEWQTKLLSLQAADPDGYRHTVTIYPDKGHWMDGEDKVALPWMAKFTRDPFPNRVVWKQDDVVSSRFYWLAMDQNQQHAGDELIAERNGQVFRIERFTGQAKRVTIRLNDTMCDLDQPIKVLFRDKSVFTGTVVRNLGTIVRTSMERFDAAPYSASVVVAL